jgi:hypothetical protein
MRFSDYKIESLSLLKEKIWLTYQVSLAATIILPKSAKLTDLSAEVENASSISIIYIGEKSNVKK